MASGGGTFFIYEHEIDFIEKYDISYDENNIIKSLVVHYYFKKEKKSVEMDLVTIGTGAFGGVVDDEGRAFYGDFITHFKNIQIHVVSARLLPRVFFEINLYNNKTLYTFKNDCVPKKDSKYPLKRYLQTKYCDETAHYSPDKKFAVSCLSKKRDNFVMYHYDDISKKIRAFTLVKSEICQEIPVYKWKSDGHNPCLYLSLPTLFRNDTMEIVTLNPGKEYTRFSLIHISNKNW